MMYSTDAKFYEKIYSINPQFHSDSATLNAQMPETSKSRLQVTQYNDGFINNMQS